MPKIIFATSLFFFVSQHVFSQVGIGTTVPDVNSVLELRSPNKALIVPRLDTATINGLQGKEGMLAYDVNNHGLISYSGSASATVVDITPVDLQGTLNPPSSFSQSFTATSTFLLQDFATALGTFNNPSTTFTISVNAGSVPGGNLLGSSTVTLGPNISPYTYVNFASNNITLVSGQVYTFTITANQTYGVYLSSANPYSGGLLYVDNNPYPNYDLAFRVGSSGAGSWQPLVSSRDTTFSTPLFNGPTIYASSYSVRAVKTGKSVTLSFKTDKTDMSVSGINDIVAINLPAAYRPAVNCYFPILIRNNNVNAIGLAYVQTSGTIFIKAGATSPVWAGANSGFYSFAATYNVP